MKRIAIFASGEGTNAQCIIDYFKAKPVEVSMIVCNNPNAGVVNRASRSGVPVVIVNKENFQNKKFLPEKLKKQHIDFIVCAGFLWKIPRHILDDFQKRIVNIHPSLLPKFGGKGMYGMNVHKAVISAKEKESGITIHYLNEQYDEGEIILQKKCKIRKSETPESLAKKIQKLEHKWYPKIIEQLLKL